MTDLAAINVDELEAGDWCDVLVAEHVCGWKWKDSAFSLNPGRRLVGPEGQQGAFWPEDASEPVPRHLPAYSTDYNACMPLAVEAKLLMTPTSDSWYASEWLANGLHAEAPTLPLAICRCLLKIAQAKAGAHD
jgi:hypothetical protein